MSRVAIAIVVSLLAGLAVGAWLLGGEPRNASEANSGSEAAELDRSLPLQQHLQRLEQMIAQERDARMVLEDQLRALNDDIERIDAGGPRAGAEPDRQMEEKREARRSVQQRPRDFASMIESMQDRRMKALLNGGFSDEEARRVMQLESQAQFEALQALHAAERAGEAVDRAQLVDAPQALLRGQLGDADYERYLDAQGQPTAVKITQVLDSSPGSRAGLQPGDEIVSYNGERVFSVNDLRALTLQGTAGEDVVIEIDRGGVRMQLNVQRGPVGITGTSANIRGLNWWGGT